VAGTACSRSVSINNHQIESCAKSPCAQGLCGTCTRRADVNQSRYCEAGQIAAQLGPFKLPLFGTTLTPSQARLDFGDFKTFEAPTERPSRCQSTPFWDVGQVVSSHWSYDGRVVLVGRVYITAGGISRPLPRNPGRTSRLTLRAASQCRHTLRLGLCRGTVLSGGRCREATSRPPCLCCLRPIWPR
jgi:hypothetical protein